MLTEGAMQHKERNRLLRKFKPVITSYPQLNRQLVSFQANKKAPFYSWFPYKEGFSAQMVDHLLSQFGGKTGTLLDPFAGSGTALFAGAEHGWDGIGIELLPVGQIVFEARLLAADVNTKRFRREIGRAQKVRWEDHYDADFQFRHVAITAKAFPKQNEKALTGFLAYCKKHVNDAVVRRLLQFACLCVLEDISYTRKDGQYLRWDHRSGKPRSSTFRKPQVLRFSDAIKIKLETMYKDIVDRRENATELFPKARRKNTLDFRVGSCLQTLPNLKTDSIDLVLTSPPYCNRYDYTRTYALELVYLQATDADIKRLRQSMLSCTVENREKRQWLASLYERLGRCDVFEKVTKAFDDLGALHEVLEVLEQFRARDELNNSNIPKMVRNYFYEMCFVVHELTRVLRRGGRIVMVNDNVRYAGEEVPVDLMLCEMAENFGLSVKHIWTLARGKGNSSQQMGSHGRTELRKCVYVWEK